MPIKVYRGPDTGGRLVPAEEAYIGAKPQSKMVKIDLSLTVSGGRSRVELRLGPDVFEELAAAMLAAAQPEAIVAIGKALAATPHKNLHNFFVKDDT